MEDSCSYGIAAAYLTSSSLSLVGSFMIIISYGIFLNITKDENKALRVVFFLALSDFLSSLNNVIVAEYNAHITVPVPPEGFWRDTTEYPNNPCSNVTDEDFNGPALYPINYTLQNGSVVTTTCEASGWCLIEANINHFFTLSSVLWVLCIATQVFLVVVREQKRPSLLPYHFVCWGVPLVGCIVLMSTQRFGPDFVTCWIVNGNFWYRIGFFNIFVLAGFIYMLTLYILIGVHLKRLHKQVEKLGTRRGSQVSRLLRRFTAYPALFLLVWIGPNIVDLNPYGESPCFLLVIKSACFPSQGFFNAVAYGINERLYHKYRELCHTLREKAKHHQLQVEIERKSSVLATFVEHEGGSPYRQLQEGEKGHHV
uniref:G-protein coupled receptors family 2 profile 2 domain-containing protein n=1 Tax=Palpitomonas bilix TaxID=652834 RepID=A0A7S3G605_9EUKA|mmetsp:Transcript_29656/g.76613  ORF Transcript_29656/g.76613 Transcript_29656/m.76613 type:complete len:369 (+) Transcript_29656:401-1507(+)